MKDKIEEILEQLHVDWFSGSPEETAAKIIEVIKNQKEKHIHEVKDVAGGTSFNEKRETVLSDVVYQCDCGFSFVRYISPEKYIKRDYDKTILIEILQV